jgi:NAD(P) transhydrogenase subunit alpha
MLVAGSADTPLLKALGFIAVVFGAANVFGGFVVTDRMLEMFKKREVPTPQREAEKKEDA